MRVLTHENVPGAMIAILRQKGHDVVSAKESLRGVPDRVVLARAQAEERILLTFDKEFGELAFRFELPAACGIVLFRLSGASPERDTARALAALESRQDWAGHFAVVTDDRIRLRLLPSRST